MKSKFRNFLIFVFCFSKVLLNLFEFMKGLENTGIRAHTHRRTGQLSLQFSRVRGYSWVIECADRGFRVHISPCKPYPSLSEAAVPPSPISRSALASAAAETSADAASPSHPSRPSQPPTLKLIAIKKKKIKIKNKKSACTPLCDSIIIFRTRSSPVSGAENPTVDTMIDEVFFFKKAKTHRITFPVGQRQEMIKGTLFPRKAWYCRKVSVSR